MSIPVLGEYINCRGMVRAVTNIESLHLWHVLEEEAAHPLLAFWKPKQIKNKQTKIKNRIAEGQNTPLLTLPH